MPGGGHVAGHRVVGKRDQLDRRVELRLRHAQVGEVLLRVGRELLRDLRRAPCSARVAASFISAHAAAQCRVDAGEVVLLLLKLGFLRVERVAIRDQFVRRLAVARLELLQERDALLDLLQPVGVGLESLGEVAAGVGEVFDFRAAALRAADSLPRASGRTPPSLCASLMSFAEHFGHRALVVDQPGRDGAR